MRMWYRSPSYIFLLLTTRSGAVNVDNSMLHHNDVMMSAMAYQITGVSIVCSTVGSDGDQRKYQSSVSLVFVRGIHRWPVNSPHKGPVTRKMFPLDDVIMTIYGQNIINNEIFLMSSRSLRRQDMDIYIYIREIKVCARGCLVQIDWYDLWKSLYIPAQHISEIYLKPVLLYLERVARGVPNNLSMS